MGGEITLRGKVRPIGGLKEKLLAAHRADIPKVLIPKDNEPDLQDVPKAVLDSIEVRVVQHMDEVLVEAGARVEAGDTIATVAGSDDDASNGLYFELRVDGTPLDPRAWCVSR